MEDLSSGREFAGHRIEDVAGRGGMGVVYRATHLALGRVVALKVIAGEYADDPDFRERFQRESRTAAALDQPHVLPIYHAGEEDGQLFITMRYVEETDLRELIADRGRLDPLEAATIVDQTAQALDAAHRGGLVHRDVKPANILISSRGGKPHAYLTDFGLTKSTASGGGLTKTGMWVGTLDYVAPEQIQGQQIDGRTDVYALAAVLYQALTGDVPYPKDSDVAKLWAHINDPPPSVTDAVPELASELDEVIRRGMANDPEERYPSAGDLGRAALAAAEGSLPAGGERSVAAGAAAPGGREAPPADPTVAAGAAAQETTASPTAGSPPPPGAPPTATGGAPPPPTAPSPPPPPPPAAGGAKRSRRLPLIVGAGVLGLVALGAVLAVAGVFGGGGEDPPPEPAGNVAGEVVGEPIEVGKSPLRIEEGPTGVFTANLDDGTISIIDPATDAVDTVKVGGAPSEVIEGEGGIWTTNYAGAITRIDPGTRDVSDPIEVGGRTASLDVGEGAVWVTNDQDDTVEKVDPSSLETVGSPIDVGSKPIAVAVGDGVVYVADDGEDTVSEILVDGDRVFEALQLDGRPLGLIYEGPRLYVGEADETEILITPYDENSLAPGTSVTIAENSSSVIVDEERESYWAAQPTDGTVTRFALDDGAQIGEPIEVGPSPQGVIATDEFVWVADGEDNTVTKIDPGDG